MNILDVKCCEPLSGLIFICVRSYIVRILNGSSAINSADARVIHVCVCVGGGGGGLL